MISCCYLDYNTEAGVQVRRRPLSFTSAQEMRARIEILPGPPAWKEMEVHVEGGTTRDPLTLYYRDGLECFKHIFGCPLYDKYMDFVPRREYTNGEKTERLYNEMMTGDRAWTLQVYLSSKLLTQNAHTLPGV